MKLFKGIKFTALIALVLGVAVGCASTPQEEKPVQDAVAMAKAAIADAKAANAEAKAAGAAWRDTDDLIAQAEKALAEGDTGTAIQLAEKAKRQAENALRQKALEEQRLADAAATSVASTMDSYTVAPGDSLWAISAKGSIYGNPYQWPLIYKANRSRIEDADLIYPGQEFDIERDASSAAIDSAINHARTRGAWSLGVIEASDTAYLSR
ncbi:MAG: LysM peptidoglycan-binding domain-containing protein [Gammaproteobacteria bacterium]|nr:LysM peptidoglycan-binding domain-containing protein [Gammaproteobacteria bacterium]